MQIVTLSVWGFFCVCVNMSGVYKKKMFFFTMHFSDRSLYCIQIFALRNMVQSLSTANTGGPLYSLKLRFEVT